MDIYLQLNFISILVNFSCFNNFQYPLYEIIVFYTVRTLKVKYCEHKVQLIHNIINFSGYSGSPRHFLMLHTFFLLIIGYNTTTCNTIRREYNSIDTRLPLHYFTIVDSTTPCDVVYFPSTVLSHVLDLSSEFVFDSFSLPSKEVHSLCDNVLSQCGQEEQRYFP